MKFGKSGMKRRSGAEELQKIGQSPWLKLHITELDLMEKLEQKVPYVERLLAIIKGVGSITIAGFIAEVGDIRRFDSPKRSRSMLDWSWVKTAPIYDYYVTRVKIR